MSSPNTCVPCVLCDKSVDFSQSPLFPVCKCSAGGCHAHTACLLEKFTPVEHYYRVKCQNCKVTKTLDWFLVSDCDEEVEKPLTEVERDVRFETIMLKKIGYSRRDLKRWNKLAKKTLAGKMDLQQASELFDSNMSSLSERMTNMNLSD
jgi:hypothetical protein